MRTWYEKLLVIITDVHARITRTLENQTWFQKDRVEFRAHAVTLEDELRQRIISVYMYICGYMYMLRQRRRADAKTAAPGQ